MAIKRRFFSHGHIRTFVGIFGSVFNKVFVARFSDDGTSIDKLVHVPIVYLPRSRIFLNSLKPTGPNGPDEAVMRNFSSTFPRMAYEFKGVSYIPERQYQKDRFKKVGTRFGKTPVPYSLSFELNIVARDQLTAAQVLEQIIPYFKPSITIEYKSEVFENVNGEADLVLTSINLDDDWSELDKSRQVVYTLSFELVANFWPYVTGADIVLKDFVGNGGEISVPIAELCPDQNGGEDIQEGTLITSVVVDTHNFDVYPNFWPAIERTTITADNEVTETPPTVPIPDLP